MSRGRSKDDDALPDRDFVTSEDLFGDMVDAPLPEKDDASAPAARRGPIRVKMTEPERGKSPSLASEAPDRDTPPIPLAIPGAGGDADPEPPAVLEPPPPPRAPSRRDPLRAATSTSAAKREDARKEQAEVDALLARLDPVFDAAPEPPVATPPPSLDIDDLGLDVSEPAAGPAIEARAEPDPVRAPEPEPERVARPAPPAVPPDLGPPVFNAAIPRKTPVSTPKLDLAALAEDALEEAAVPRRREASWRDDVFGPYKLIDRVAVGGMAEVFKAKRTGVEGFEKVVAVKRILPHLSDNKEFVDMFVDEAKMVAGLTHPNIVQIFDLGKIETSYYIAMEYVHGRDLRTITKRAREKGLRMPLDLALRVVGQVCAALEYAHRKKDDRGRPMEIVHRDVSPQNILISFEGDVKLADFGIAKAATKASSTDRGALRGKLLYMSPEQAWGRPIDRRSDVFSLGIVLYELLTEQKPFLGGASEMSILETVRRCEIVPPRSVNGRLPEALDRTAMKALAREPEERFQDAGEMQRALERALDRPAVTAAELARFLEVLFDAPEREEADEPAKAAAPEAPAPVVEEDLAEADQPEMSIDTLLKRFGIQ
jgi:serine/threonine protein kinase